MGVVFRGNIIYTITKHRIQSIITNHSTQYGSVVSKHLAARWAQENLCNRWEPLIERTWEGRHNPGVDASSEEVNETLGFIRYALEYIGDPLW